MTIRAAYAKAGDARVYGSRRQLHRFGEQPKSAIGQPKLCVLGFGEPGRWYNSVVQAQDDLDQPGNAGCALSVAEVALDRPDRTGLVAARAMSVGKGFRLDHVA